MNQIIRILFFTLPLVVSAQTDFNDYSILQSVGEVPSDFTTPTYAKIGNDFNINSTSLNRSRQLDFLEETRYAIDGLLKSGSVVFGDKVSRYISDVGDNILKKNDINGSLIRFYTLKSEIANAFSTDQGIIFVTTGLISQLENEAQLAYILCHEICHYTEKHLVETFVFKQNSNNLWIQNMSKYSRTHEFSADKLAVPLYLKSGYSREEIITSFDVLLYSYLPFDEIEVPLDFYNIGPLQLPDSMFLPRKQYAITADAYIDDSHSTHPNIGKRKEAVLIEVENSSIAVSDEIYFFSEDRFKEIRDISRFETVRQNLLKRQYSKALYAIFLLDKKYPDSEYLHRMKAQTWLGIYLFKTKSIMSKFLTSDANYEGESAFIDESLSQFSHEEISTIALRNIFDLRHLHHENDEIKTIYETLIKELKKDYNFPRSSYHRELSTLVLEANPDLKISDSAKKLERSLKPYYLFGLPDVIIDQEFDRLYTEKTIKKPSDIIDTLILLNPEVVSINNKGQDKVRSEMLNTTFYEAIMDGAESSNVTMKTISTDNRIDNADQFNDRSILLNHLISTENESLVQVFPVDYPQIHTLIEKSGTSNVLVIGAFHTNSVTINPWVMGCSAFFTISLPFTLGIYVPIQIMKGNRMLITYKIIDVLNREESIEEVYLVHENIGKYNLGAHMYNIFTNLNK